MKRVILSISAIAAMSSLSFAGGDFETPEEPQVIVSVVVDESGFYLGGAIAAVVGHDSAVGIELIDGTPGVDNDRLGNITLFAGYDFNRYVAVEGRYTTDVIEGDVTEMSGWSLFAKPQYTFDDSYFKIYALLGFGGVTIDGINGYFADVDDTDFQWGIGAAYSFGEYMEDNNLAVFVDYTSLATEMEGVFTNGALETDVDAFTVGLTYKF